MSAIPSNERIEAAAMGTSIPDRTDVPTPPRAARRVPPSAMRWALFTRHGGSGFGRTPQEADEAISAEQRSYILDQFDAGELEDPEFGGLVTDRARAVALADECEAEALAEPLIYFASDSLEALALARRHLETGIDQVTEEHLEPLARWFPVGPAMEAAAQREAERAVEWEAGREEREASIAEARAEAAAKAEAERAALRAAETPEIKVARRLSMAIMHAVFDDKPPSIDQLRAMLAVLEAPAPAPAPFVLYTRVGGGIATVVGRTPEEHDARIEAYQRAYTAHEIAMCGKAEDENGTCGTEPEHVEEVVRQRIAENLSWPMVRIEAHDRQGINNVLQELQILDQGRALWELGLDDAGHDVDPPAALEVA